MYTSRTNHVHFSVSVDKVMCLESLICVAQVDQTRLGLVSTGECFHSSVPQPYYVTELFAQGSVVQFDMPW